jgi:hypothetical protein
VHSHELITVKILEFYPAHVDLLVTNGLSKYAQARWHSLARHLARNTNLLKLSGEAAYQEKESMAILDGCGRLVEVESE